MLAWMSYIVVVSLLLGLAALAFERSARIRKKPTRWLWGTSWQLCLAAPIANGFQPTLTSKNRSANRPGQHDAASSQFGLPGIVDGDVVSILGLVIGALKECLIFGPGQHHQLLAAGRPNDLWCAHSFAPCVQ
jgi:hypothetical protein